MQLFLALAALAAPASAAIHSEMPYVNGWSKSSVAVRDNERVKVTIVVKEQGRDEIRSKALAVSDPSSPDYGNFLTRAQVDDITRPKAEDMSAVTSWLDSHGVGYKLQGVSSVIAEMPVSAASELFSTTFHRAEHRAHGQALIRASDYEIPAEVENSISTVFGLHGLPLPPRDLLIAAHGLPKRPANVTPDVLNQVYGIEGVKVSRSEKNKQAVAEFQGQFMNSTDLSTLFKNYVDKYEEGTDDKVYKWVGKHIENSGGVEAELDIQYIMGISVGIKTEFWEFPGQDFGADLHQWTGNLTSQDDAPIVHSVSYGWQGNLSQIHVKDSDVDAVDSNFKKCATMGISIMISSGDSGSGYSSQDRHCMEPNAGSKGTGLEGDVEAYLDVHEMAECCEEAEQRHAAGWTFVPATHPDMLEAKPAGFEFKDTIYHDMEEGVIRPGQPSKGGFTTRDVFVLNGKLTKEGGDVKCKNLNGTYPETTIEFSAASQPEKGMPEVFRNVSAKFGSKKMTGRAVFIAFPGQPERCVNIEWRHDEGESIWEEGPNPPPPPPPGHCTLYKTVTKHNDNANSSTFSGVKAAKAKVVLWPSWPASSPWVTAVGATRFTDQKVGNPEMASDQFGSGGGFSKQFDQSDAQYQADAVAKYLKTVDQSTLPPADSFPAKGRATPDVSTLGEGYQVVVGGRVNSVGGTSASSPAFAGMISMLNEARFNAGKKQLGFLNPFLYSNEDAFTDVTLGSNKVGRGGQPLPYGWNCSKGWDPATGLGTPLFKKLLKAALAK
jgi:subtilase family serine protease